MSNKAFIAILLWIAFIALTFTALFIGDDFRPLMYKMIAFIYIINTPMIVAAIHDDWKK